MAVAAGGGHWATVTALPLRDYIAWHDAYRDPSSDLSRRLAVVQEEIRNVLAAKPDGRLQVISMCAGQGHDLIGVLADDPQADRVRALLVELEPANVAKIREKASAAGLQLDVVQGDAADTEIYRQAVPADLVLAVGVFGNITDADIHRVIRALPQFCAPGGAVIWTRGRHLPDINAEIHAAFDEAGFVPVAFRAPPDAGFQVGVNRYEGPAVPLVSDRLFTFVV